MKMQGQRLLKEISKEQMKHLTKEVKETVAYACDINHVKIFSAIDLWDIQRRRKAIYQRRTSI